MTLKTVPLSLEYKSTIESWFNDDEVGNKRMSSYSDVENWLRLLDKSSRFSWIILVNNKPIGFIDLERLDDGASFAFYLVQNFRGKGLGKSLVTEAIHKAREYNIRKLNAAVEKDNNASIRSLESNGFIKCVIDKDGLERYEFDISHS